MSFDDEDFDFDNLDFDSNEDDLRGGVGGDDLGEDLTDDFSGGFDDELSDFDEGEEGLSDLDELGDEFGFDEDEGEGEGGGGGPSRTFIMLAGAMIVLFIVALVVVVVLATRPKGLTNPQMTASAVVVYNNTQYVFATQTQVANATLFAQQTLDAAASPTPSPTTVPSVTFNNAADVRSGPDPVFEVIDTATAGDTAEIVAVNPGGNWYQVRYTGGEGWVSAADVSVTGSAAGVPVADVPTPVLATPTLLPFDMTSTALAQPTTAPEITEVATEPPVDAAQAVAMTATALANLLVATPTLEQVGPPIGGATAAPGAPTALPGTGFIDDVLAGGSQGFGVLLLMAVGLLGVIVVSRRLRTATSK